MPLNPNSIRSWPTNAPQMPVVPEGARQSTLNLNSIHGGESETGAGGKPDDYDGLPSPNVAESCRMILDRRFLIEKISAR